MSLFFPADNRPGAKAIRELACTSGGFSISIDPAENGRSETGWLELLANGLTFDLTGLSPSRAAPTPDVRHAYGFGSVPDTRLMEAITLLPGPHLGNSIGMVPVLRWMAMLGAQLADLPGTAGVLWHGAATCCAPDYFRRNVRDWIAGGAFPGLALTALSDREDGGLQSEGLALFTGQELIVTPQMCEDRPFAAKTALRLVDWLVQNGRVESPIVFTGPDGDPVGLDPADDGLTIQVWKGAR